MLTTTEPMVSDNSNKFSSSFKVDPKHFFLFASVSLFLSLSIEYYITCELYDAYEIRKYNINVKSTVNFASQQFNSTSISTVNRCGNKAGPTVDESPVVSLSEKNKTEEQEEKEGHHRQENVQELQETIFEKQDNLHISEKFKNPAAEYNSNAEKKLVCKTLQDDLKTSWLDYSNFQKKHKSDPRVFDPTIFVDAWQGYAYR